MWKKSTVKYKNTLRNKLILIQYGFTFAYFNVQFTTDNYFYYIYFHKL